MLRNWKKENIEFDSGSKGLIGSILRSMALPAPGPNDPHHAEARVATPPKRIIARSFGRKAETYKRHAVFQSHLVELLVSRLVHRERQGIWIDAGCGAGSLAELCREAGATAAVIGLDIALEPLIMQRRSGNAPLVQADIDDLPLRPASVDGFITTSTLQWLADPLQALHSIADVVKPGGFLAWSVFIGDSFNELFSMREYFGLSNNFRAMEPSGFLAGLEQAGFTPAEHETVRMVVHAPDASTHLKNLGAIGGTAVAGRRLLRKELAAFCTEYERRFRTEEGVPLTYYALFGVAAKGVLS
jgi:malonyl-CoA O-methyltransferase